MSTRRLMSIETIPNSIKRAFKMADNPAVSEEKLWRERAARMTLDALGHTNLTVKPKEHNAAVLYSRRWFRGLFTDHPDVNQTDDALATFDCGGVEFHTVRDAVLSIEPLLFELEEDEDDDETHEESVPGQA